MWLVTSPLKFAEGSGRGLIWVTILEFVWKAENLIEPPAGRDLKPEPAERNSEFK
jgi:hypothetical protein